MGGTGGCVEVFTASATQLHALQAHPAWAWAVAAHPAGGLVAVGGDHGGVALHALDVAPMAVLAGNMLAFRCASHMLLQPHTLALLFHVHRTSTQCQPIRNVWQRVATWACVDVQQKDIQIL